MRNRSSSSSNRNIRYIVSGMLAVLICFVVFQMLFPSIPNGDQPPATETTIISGGGGADPTIDSTIAVASATTEEAPTAAITSTLTPTISTPMTTPTDSVNSITSPVARIPCNLNTTFGKPKVAVNIVVSLAGTLASTGQGRQKATTLAFNARCQEIEKENFEVELIVWNDQGITTTAELIATEISKDPANLCVIGHSNSNTSNSAKIIYHNNTSQITMITPSSSDPTVTQNVDNVVRLVGTDDGQGRAGAKLAIDSGYRNPLIVVPGNRVNAVTAANAFSETFAMEFNITPTAITFAQVLNDGAEADFSPLQRELEERHSNGTIPDVIYYAGNIRDLIQFLTLLKSLPIDELKNIPIIGIDGLDDETALGSALQSAGWASPIKFTTMSLPSDAGKGPEFAELFQGVYPGYAPESYDGTTLCIKAIINAIEFKQMKGLQGAVTAQEVLTEIRKISRIPKEDMDYYANPYVFDRQGNSIQQLYFVREYKNRELRTQPIAIECAPQCSNYSVDIR